MSNACCTSSENCQDESSSYTCPHHGTSTTSQPPLPPVEPSLEVPISNPLDVHSNSGPSLTTPSQRHSSTGRRQSRPPPLAFLRRDDDCFIDPCLELPQFAVTADPTLSTLSLGAALTALASPLPRGNDDHDEDSGGSLTWQDDHEPLSSPAIPSDNRRAKHVFFSISEDSSDMPLAAVHERDVELGEASLRLHQTNVVQGATSPRTSLTGITHVTDNAKPPMANAMGNNVRQRQPRLSLHGKAVSLRRHRRDARYRKLQAKVYNFLERPRGFRAITYHMLVFLLVFGCFCLTVLSTVPDFEDSTQQPLFWMELVVVVWFTVEFLLRMWSVGCRSRYQGVQGRLLFFKRPFTVIDTIIIFASIVVLGLGSHGQVFAASALRGLRFFQILRMVRMDRRGGTWKLLGSVVWAHRQELLTTFYIGFLGLIFSSFLIYLVEKDINERFTTFADALWWGVITLATVGYGDSVPISWKGKLIAGICAMMGISFFALPASILGSGFALKVQQQQRQKHLIRRRNPAALLIQCMWRCYAADERSCSVATWEPHLRGLRQSAAASVSSMPYKFHASSTSFVSRFSTIKRPKHVPNHVPPAAHGASGHGPHAPATAVVTASSALTSLKEGVTHTLKSASSGDLLRRVNSARKTYSAPPDNAPTSGERARPSKGSITGVAQHHRRMALTQPEELRKALEDDDETSSVDGIVQRELTDQQRRAIRAIRKMKYLVAKRKFREALKPYDVKDVIEQYSAGHVDLLARVKNLQQRCDQLLGKQNSKSVDSYDSKVCLALRVVKIERQVDDIEGKIDTVLDLLMQQRGLPSSGSDTSPDARTETKNSRLNLGKTTKLRPILLNHQSSDPMLLNIPGEGDTTSADYQNRPNKRRISRGYSDLGLMKSSTREESQPAAVPPASLHYEEMTVSATLEKSASDTPLVTVTHHGVVIDSVVPSPSLNSNSSAPNLSFSATEEEPAFIDDDSETLLETT
ncbi:hypothetical protein RvY_12174 [Ramazzottius varieornatus]|uniref:Potassium voltage-gated channel subfamily KQT member 1 n=1 Tax=Ramazzottius varieornatus TaxID=947166 RepID=A0A1D1VIK0_RAMVA|nr:hypothetical protein RvY_12174 [Ramazzottius varieornatus]